MACLFFFLLATKGNLAIGIVGNDYHDGAAKRKHNDGHAELQDDELVVGLFRVAFHAQRHSKNDKRGRQGRR